MLLASRKLVLGQAEIVLPNYVFCLRPSSIKNCAFITRIRLINLERYQESNIHGHTTRILSILFIKLNPVIIRHNNSNCCEF